MGRTRGEGNAADAGRGDSGKHDAGVHTVTPSASMLKVMSAKLTSLAIPTSTKSDSKAHLPRGYQSVSPHDVAERCVAMRAAALFVQALLHAIRPSSTARCSNPNI